MQNDLCDISNYFGEVEESRAGSIEKRITRIVITGIILEIRHTFTCEEVRKDMQRREQRRKRERMPPNKARWCIVLTSPAPDAMPPEGIPF